MMNSNNLFLFSILYLAIIFVIAQYANSNTVFKKWVSNNALVYTLSIGVYCTSWTLFGSVQSATVNGALFLAVYIGPSVGLFVWPLWLKKILPIKEKYRITSIADFISARFNKSITIGVIISLFLYIGFIPYFALQIRSLLKCIELVLDLKTSTSPSKFNFFYYEVVLLILIVIVTILFGLRKIETVDKEPALIASLSFESVVKLFAMLIGGGYLIYHLSQIETGSSFFSFENLNVDKINYAGALNFPQALNWLVYLVLSFFAIFLLPRQFHVAVIENRNPKNIDKMQWMLPIYLFLISILVLPIAYYITLFHISPGKADEVLIAFPLSKNNYFIAMLVYFGGLSACMGMITAEGVALATMMTNQVLMPVFQNFQFLHFLRPHILKFRWIAVAVLVFCGYLFHLLVGATTQLIPMGMISFVAIFQLVPSFLIGLFSTKFSSKAVIVGLIFGFLCWFYMLMYPALSRAGVFSIDILNEGLFGIELLKPESFLGINNLTTISHATIWSFIFNISGIIITNSFTSLNKNEEIHAEEFLQSSSTLVSEDKDQQQSNISLKEKTVIINKLLLAFTSKEQADNIITEIYKNVSLIDKEYISIGELYDLNKELEKELSGRYGTAAAHQALKNSELVNDNEERHLTRYLARLLSSLKISPSELNEKINYHIEKEKLLKNYYQDLENELNATSELLMKSQEKLIESQEQLIQSNKMASLGEMAGGVAHEINTPLSVIILHSNRLIEKATEGPLKDDIALTTVKKINSMAMRISSIVRALKTFSHGGDKEEKSIFKAAALIEDTLALCREKIKLQSIILNVSCDNNINFYGSFTQLSQVLLNLVQNSIDAIESLNDKWINIQVTETDIMTIMRVTDSGNGISKEIKEKIMQPFFTTKPIGKGTGLGLSISLGIIQSHQGKFYIDDCANTSFVVEIPKN